MYGLYSYLSQSTLVSWYDPDHNLWPCDIYMYIYFCDTFSFERNIKFNLSACTTIHNWQNTSMPLDYIHYKGYNGLVHVQYILPIFHFSSTRVLWYSSVPQLQKPLAGCTPTHVYSYCYQSDSFSSDRFKLDFCLSRIYGRSGLHW